MRSEFPACFHSRIPCWRLPDLNPSSEDQTIERLERIEILHKKGLISDEEYKQLRARIIDKL